jgi:hypothetical protein
MIFFCKVNINLHQRRCENLNYRHSWKHFNWDLRSSPLRNIPEMSRSYQYRGERLKSRDLNCRICLETIFLAERK